MRISKLDRGGSPSKRFPMAELREQLRDGRVWCGLGVVFKPDNGEHFYLENSNGKTRVYVEVQTLPEGLDLTCRLATRPTWYIPTVGTTVAVLIPSGEVDHCPLVVGVLDAGEGDEEITVERTLVKTELPYVVKAPSILLGGTDADQAVPQGDNQRAALNALASALQTYIGAIQSIADPTTLATAAMGSALNTFKSASYLSPVSKTK